MHPLTRNALATYKLIDIWVNAAGIAVSYGPTLGIDPQEFNQVIQTIIVGTYNGSRTTLAIMVAQGSGKLINLLGMGYNGPTPLAERLRIEQELGARVYSGTGR